MIRSLESEMRNKLLAETQAKVDNKTKEIVEIRKVRNYDKLVKQQKFLSLCLFLDNSELENIVSDIENAKKK